MADKPISFTAPMIRALLAGRKTQMRWVLKQQPNMPNGGAPVNDGSGLYSINGRRKRAPIRIGNRRWVRETFSGPHAFSDLPPRDWSGRVFDTSDIPIWYWADGNPSVSDLTLPKASFLMPRWASRLTLTVTDVRVERLQDISEDDAMAEGVEPRGPAPHCLSEWLDYSRQLDDRVRSYFYNPRDSFKSLWNSINGPDAWGENPWVAAYNFTVHRGNIDQLKGGAA